MKISLVGYMASGKTTVGNKLAKELNLSFRDLDQDIEKGEERSISELFKKEGEAFFRKKEHEYLCKLLENKDDSVLSLGGGTPCYKSNMKLINEKSFTIYLKASTELLCKRLIKESENRPIVASVGKEALPAFIEKHLNEREKFYSAANLIVSANQELSSIVREIVLKLKSLNSFK